MENTDGVRVGVEALSAKQPGLSQEPIDVLGMGRQEKVAKVLESAFAHWLRLGGCGCWGIRLDL